MFSKIFEKAIFSLLIDFLNSKHLSHDFQFGFRAKYSTEHARATLLNCLHLALDSGLTPAALSLDVRKAFNSLTHKIPLWKLPYIGIRGSAYSWFLSYLSGRVISIDRRFSNPSRIEFDVPQGSSIGLIFFLIYVNDLISVVKNFKPTICCRLCQAAFVTNCDGSSSLPDTLIAFADDSTLSTTGRTESDLRSRMIERERAI